ncbi:hypothetical protein KZ813_06580 [Sphingomonas sp. RHCKR7]|uniref:hypothetical protein n=1 Tax=Sphingomonas folli TaxID=2862497 RepID=UPI001CA59E61|nr:hypothetical protein [Sphingomonas folli]MBW6526502.1 hypothetical protein [Sphingomonas folli]
MKPRPDRCSSEIYLPDRHAFNQIKKVSPSGFIELRFISRENVLGRFGTLVSRINEPATRSLAAAKHLTAAKPIHRSGMARADMLACGERRARGRQRRRSIDVSVSPAAGGHEAAIDRRAYLIETFRRAVRDGGRDGLKLDLIDMSRGDETAVLGRDRSPA